MLTTTLLSLSFLSLLPSSSSYDLVREYSGPTFFDRWDFYGSWDNLTLGVLARIFTGILLSSPSHLSSKAMFGGWTALRLSGRTWPTSTRTIVSS
jgi:hypothetical protein